MIEFIFKSQEKTLTRKLPETWNEITVRQFVALETLTDPLTILSEVLDADLSYIEASMTNLTPALNRVIQILNARPPDLEDRKPEGFIFQGQKIKLPRDIDNLMFGQLIQINMLLEESPIANLIKIMGIAVQPILDGKYIEENQERYAKLIGMLPIVEVYPEMFFFAEKLKKHSKYGKIDFPLSL